jgi:CBS domain-containing protein
VAEFPFQRVLEFVRQAVPFDALPPEELERAVAAMEIAYFPKGQAVITEGGPPADHLYLIHSGSAKVVLAGGGGEGREEKPAQPGDGREGSSEILVDIRGEGDTFGAVSLLQGSQALFTVIAREDLICYCLPAQAFRRLVEAHPAFDRHFSQGLARNLEAVRRGGAGDRARQAAGLGGYSLEAALVRSPVSELMSRPVLSCLPATPVRAAARRMSQRRVGSMVVADEGGHPLGVLTDTDLRVRVVSAGRDLDEPIADFMSRPVLTIAPEALGLEALITMSRHGVHHLVVVEDGRMVGVVCDHDLQTVAGMSPVGVVADIQKVDSVDELVQLHRKMDRVLENLLRQGGSARTMLELVTEFNDRLTLKLIELTESAMEHQGRGRPPVPYVWTALGSEGRREQTLRTDQDNALVFANLPEERAAGVQRWFLEFAGRVVDGLEACGFPRCRGGVMANNPRWCQTQKAWRRTFLGWVRDPKPETLRLASIFFDFRPIYAEADFLDKLESALRHAIEGNALFLRFLAKNALYNRPPLGFLRQFVVSKEGEHKNKLDLKLSGLTPIVDAVRVLALDQGVDQAQARARLHEISPRALVTNTLDRLEEITRRGLVKPELAEDLREAFSFITILRITHHLEARARGEVPDNHVDPASLNSLQRKMLKESFGVITKLQELLEHRYQTWLVT